MRKIKNKKYHYFYKITNLINNHFYYGIHSTDNLEDGYMGSGTRLHKAYEKYGIENFEKEILKFFDSREECAEYEMEMVTEELVHDYNCYNISCGGEHFNTIGSVSVKDENGNCFRCSIYDEDYINGKLKGVKAGLVTVKDKNTSKYVNITQEEYYKNKDNYIVGECSVWVKNNKSDDSYFLIPLNEYRNNKDLYIHKYSDFVLVKDKDNNNFYVRKDDPRYISGELKLFWKDRHHTDETKRKISEKFKNNKHQQGEKNSQYGTCWIYKNGENKKIKKEELILYIQQGWIKGRKVKND